MESAVSNSLRQMQYIARIIGSKLESQVETFRKCLSTAESIELNPNRTHEMLVPLGAMMEDLQEVAAGPGHILQNHMGALSAATELLAWLTMNDPSVAVSEAKEKAAPFISALRSMDHSLHREFGNAVHSFLSQASDYITIKHKTGLMFVATGEPQSNGKADSTLEISDKFTAHHLMYFKERIFLGSLKEYMSVSSSLGDVVSKQATAVVDAFKELYNFIVKASDSKKPSSSEDLQTMLTPIGMKMGLVAEIASTCPPHEKFQNHVTAVQEAINMLSWVSADSKPISFVSDADGSSGFYLNKILTSTKSNSDASNHKAFVQSIKNLLSEMRTYIKEYHTMGVSYGIGLYAKGGSEELASQFSSSVNLEESGRSYVTAFQEIIDGSLAEYVTASNMLGGEVAEQANPFARAFNAEREFLAKAYCTPKPDDIQSLLTPIANEMAAVSAVAEKADPRGPYANHCTAVSESVGALGWVAVDEKATAFVGDMAGAGQFFIDKIKMGAKKTDNPKGHRIWAKALEQLYSDLKEYVKEHHTQKLTWNPPKQKRAQSSVEKRIVNCSGDESGDYVTKFKELIDGPLSKYVEASNKLGGEVSEQATVFAAAWRAEADFLSKAICTPKPNDVQSILEPIAVKIGAVSAIAEKVDPRGPFANHCTAVSESVSALGWVAVDEKATSFVGDMAGAGQFFLDKVKMCAKKTEDPEAHRAWAKSLEYLYAELKAYVKENHTQHLTWNPPHRAKSAQRSNPRAIVPENETGGDYVSKFREVIDAKLAPFITASNKLGGEVAGQASVFAAAWMAEADFLAKAFCTPKPDDFQDMLAPLATQMGLVSAVAEKMDPRGPLANHCTAVSESVSTLGWVAVDEKATAFVGDMAAAGQFYLNKVKMGAKKTNDPAGHREWAIALEELYAALKAYVKDHHTQKLVWNLANR